MSTRESLAASFLAAGVRRGGILLAHSSLRAFGRVDGGADTIIDALLDALGPEGTLVIPTLSYLFCTRASPSFDVRTTPTNLGAIPTAFLKRAAAQRSEHPTHSCAAIGPAAAEILSAHATDTTPVGSCSPFRRVRDSGGKGQVAFLGCGTRCNTSIHGVEETLVVTPPYLFSDTPVEIEMTDAAGQTRRVSHTRHGFETTAQRYERLESLLPPSAISRGYVGEAECVVMDARTMWETAFDALSTDGGALTAPVVPGAEEGHHLVRGSDGSFRYVVAPNPT
jgi:aminoglycoside 3-N-acetyltransferase